MLAAPNSVFQTGITTVGARPVPETKSRYATNRIEQLLIMATVTLLPLQEYVPAVGGFSVMYLLFAGQAAYILAKRPECLAQVWLHPLLLAIYVFLCIGYLIEMSHPYSYYGEIFQMIQSFGGAAFLASLCRDRKALRYAMYGYLGSGLIFAFNLLFYSYGSLNAASAVDYGEADRIRDAVFSENPLEYNLNGMAFFTAQATAVACALALTARSRMPRFVFLGVAVASFVATFLPMSRSGIGILLAVCATTVFAYGITRIKTLVAGILLVATMLVLVPGAVFSRLTFSTEVDQFGRMEGRAQIYTAFFHHLPEVALTGVGTGNFLTAWGHQSLYAKSRGGVSGAHNVFFQMVIYWGVSALVGLGAIIWQAYQCLPGRYRDDGLAIGLLAVSVSLLLWSLTVHNLYAKEFSIGVGLLVAAQHWIWPQAGLTQRARLPQTFVRRLPRIRSPHHRRA